MYGVGYYPHKTKEYLSVCFIPICLLHSSTLILPCPPLPSPLASLPLPREPTEAEMMEVMQLEDQAVQLEERHQAMRQLQVCLEGQGWERMCVSK